MKNIKLVSVVSTAIILGGLTTVAHADTTEGAYIGGGVGMYQTDLTLKSGNNSFSMGDTKHDAGADVFAGYKWKTGVGGVAVELGYTNSYGKITDWTAGTLTIGAKLTGSTEIAILPSYNLSKDTAAYIRIGYASVKGTATNSAGTVGGVTITGSTAEKTFTGMVWGLGVDHSLSKNLALRAEYKVVDLSDVTINSLTYTPRATGLNIAVRYAF